MHVVTRKRAGMVGWMSGSAARAWGGSISRNGHLARFCGEAMSAYCTCHGMGESGVIRKRESADPPFLVGERCDPHTIRYQFALSWHRPWSQLTWTEQVVGGRARGRMRARLERAAVAAIVGGRPPGPAAISPLGAAVGGVLAEHRRLSRHEMRTTWRLALWRSSPPFQKAQIPK